MKKIYLLGLLAVAGCGSPQPDFSVQCMFEVDAPGSYSLSNGGSTPVAVPGEGGTQAGADALNACIQRKAAA